MALLRGNKGSRKLVGKGERLVTLLRSHSDPSLTDGSNLRMTFLCDVVGSRKLVGANIFRHFCAMSLAPVTNHFCKTAA